MTVEFQVKTLSLKASSRSNSSTSAKPLTCPYYGFLNKRVRYAIEFAIARYPIVVIKLAMVEATNGG